MINAAELLHDFINGRPLTLEVVVAALSNS